MLATYLLITSLPSVLLISLSSRKFCPATPAVTISITTDENGIQEKVTAVPSQTASGDDYVYFEKPTAVNFHCVANRPIELATDILMPYVVQNVEFIRNVGNVFDSSTYCYVITFKAGPDFRATGKYTCSLIENKKQFSSIFIFADGDRGSILLNNDYPFDIEGIADDDGWITIPCITTNPSLVPTIMKANQLRNNAMEELQLEPNVVEYSTGIGFKIKAMSPQCCNKHYRCELNKAKVGETVVNSETSVTLYKTEGNSQALGGKTFYRVSPSDFVLGYNEGAETKLRSTIHIKITLRCESNLGIQLGVDPLLHTENVQFHVSYSPKPKSFYQYYAELTLHVRKVGVLTVLCKLENNHKPLHKWVITTVTEEEFHHSVGIHIVPDKRYPITCFSPYATSPVISIIRCNDSINCGIADKFASRILKPGREKLSNFPYDVIEGHSSCVRNREPSNALGCAEVSPYLWSIRGIVKCREEHNDNSDIVYTQHFLIGLHKNIVSLPEHASVESGNGTEDSTILEMDSFKPTLYVDEEITVKCTASYGVFSLGIQLMFQLQDNTNLTEKNFTRLELRETQMDNVITYEGKLKITAQDIRRIWCFAPIWNSANWRSVYKDVTILPGVHPEIKGGFETESVSWGIWETGHQLRCQVGGEPMPTVRWTKDGETLTTNNTKVLNMSTIENSTTVLELEPIVVAHQGTYICEVTNVKGTSAKKFEVRISGTQNIAVYAGVVSILVVVATLLACTLVKVLRNAKRYKFLYRLTTEEILEFREGRRPASDAETAPNFLESIAYNTRYELPKNKLKVDISTILGAGSFGVVYKGTIRGPQGDTGVAFKTVRPGADVSYFKALLSELKILAHLGSHEFIVSLIGAWTENLERGEVLLAVELCECCLLNFIRINAPSFLNCVEEGVVDTGFTERYNMYDDVQGFKQFSTLNLIQWATQAATGLEFIASRKIIHGDIAARNILLTSGFNSKICDFGLARQLVDYNYIKSEQCPLPWKWMAIESLREMEFSTKSDVWAFGITLWEIFTLGHIPYPGLTWSVNFVTLLENGLRVTIPQHAPTKIWELIDQCCQATADDRPDFTLVKNILQALTH